MVTHSPSPPSPSVPSELSALSALTLFNIDGNAVVCGPLISIGAVGRSYSTRGTLLGAACPPSPSASDSSPAPWDAEASFFAPLIVCVVAGPFLIAAFTVWLYRRRRSELGHNDGRLYLVDIDTPPVSAARGRGVPPLPLFSANKGIGLIFYTPRSPRVSPAPASPAPGTTGRGVPPLPVRGSLLGSPRVSPAPGSPAPGSPAPGSPAPGTTGRGVPPGSPLGLAASFLASQSPRVHPALGPDPSDGLSFYPDAVSGRDGTRFPTDLPGHVDDAQALGPEGIRVEVRATRNGKVRRSFYL